MLLKAILSKTAYEVCLIFYFRVYKLKNVHFLWKFTKKALYTSTVIITISKLFYTRII